MISKRLPLYAILLMLCVIAVDQISKWVVVENLEPQTAYPVIPGVFRLYLVRNPGAAFSFGTGSTWVFSLIQLVAVCVALYLARGVTSRWSAVAVGLIGGGAAGNLIDRLLRSPGAFHGHVVDFFSFGSFAIFNVADAGITVGVVCYVVYSFFPEGFRGHGGSREGGAAAIEGSDAELDGGVR